MKKTMNFSSLKEKQSTQSPSFRLLKCAVNDGPLDTLIRNLS